MTVRNRQSRIQPPPSNRLVSALLRWFARHARDLPWRRTRDPYAVWVSEIMLQQTQVKTVIPYWERWMRALPTVAAVARARQDRIHKLWEGLGYYIRGRHLQQGARQIMQRHGGSFPRRFEEVLALPGVGRYTAGAICSIAFNQPTPILDGNVIRVLTRVFGLSKNPREPSTNRQLWELSARLVSGAAALERPRSPWKLCASGFNQALMELGALVCTPRQPRCAVCPIKRRCVAFREQRVVELPNLGPRAPAVPRHFVAFVVEHNRRLLVRQRPAGVVNAHLWEFPNLEMTGLPAASPPTPAEDPQDRMAKQIAGRRRGRPETLRLQSISKAAWQTLGCRPAKLQPLLTLKHSITRYRITLEAFYVRGDRTPRHSAGIWKTPGEMKRLAFASAHKKLVSFVTRDKLSGR